MKHVVWVEAITSRNTGNDFSTHNLVEENRALKRDLNEYREILCNKQKELDARNHELKITKEKCEFSEKANENKAKALALASDEIIVLRAQVKQLRSYISRMSGAST